MFSFVCAVSDPAIASQHLLASPDFNEQDPHLHLVLGAQRAAEAFNAIAEQHAATPWLIWVHEDVYLPAGWIAAFEAALHEAQLRWPALAVLGVYGTTADHQHAGEVLDRGLHLEGAIALPCLALGIDELLVAVRLSSGLRMDATLGWDFYASDLALQADAQGFQAAIVHAPCEHWSRTPRSGISQVLAERFLKAGRRYLHKWAHRLETLGALSTPSVRMACEDDLVMTIKIASQPAQDATRLGSAQKPTVSDALQNHEVRQPALGRLREGKATLEACWLESSDSLQASDEESASALSRFYREGGVHRFWHLSGRASAHQRKAMMQAFCRDWLLVLPFKQCLMTGSFAELVKALSADQAELEHPKLYRATSAHEIARYPQCPPVDYATGAGFERFGQAVKSLRADTNRDASKAYAGKPPSEQPAYWLLRHAGWDAALWQSAALAMGLIAPCEDPKASEVLVEPLFWPYSHCFYDYRLAKREEMLGYVPQDCRRLLDWGGGEGGFAALARDQRKGLEAWLAEVDEASMQQAKAKGLKVFDSREPIPLQLFGSFDFVAMLDSLEHVEAPGKLLKLMRCLLKPGGLLLLSVPHIGFAPVLGDLAAGRFEYEAIGPLCTTHRRFYSALGLQRLLDDEHFEVVTWVAWPQGSRESSDIEAFHVVARAFG